ncbi:MAG: DUF6799 domain-containing protein [Candidatus Binataceae bacterium]
MTIATIILTATFAFCAIWPGAAMAMDGVIMKNGQMMTMKNGKATQPMPDDMTMPDGTKVTTAGVVKMGNGEEKHLSNGDMILMDGHMMKGGQATPMHPEE